jgi:hypothetical protein
MPDHFDPPSDMIDRLTDRVFATPWTAETITWLYRWWWALLIGVAVVALFPRRRSR